jgi:hypothetical protein
MTHRFDDLSKSLADESVPRRESLRRLGIFFVAAALSPLGLKSAWAGPNACKNFCRCRKRKQQEQCVAACKACDNGSQDLCGSCGNYFCCGDGQACCGDFCADLASDFSNCGACGFHCEPPGPFEMGVCLDGGCAYSCVEGAVVCDGECSLLVGDPANCGGCGNVCGGETPDCILGECGQCEPGTASCGGVCIDILWDSRNCGACGNVCPEQTACANGVCEGLS